MHQNQFSTIERLSYTLLPKLPFKSGVIPLINKLRIKKISKLKTPINLIYYITNRCNAKCKHCFYWKNLNKQNNELTSGQLTKIAKSLKHPLEMLSITGGEPFLRKDIVEVCKIFYKFNKTKRINIATNGLLADTIYNSTKQILKENLHKRLTIFISIDGLEKTHDSIRGIKGSFRKAIETIKKLEQIKNKYLSIFVATTICDENYKELQELINYLKQFKIIHKFNLLRDNSTVFDIDKTLLNDFNPQISKLPDTKDLESAYQEINSNTNNLSSKVEALKIRYSIDMIKNKQPKVKCLAGLINAVIFPEGNVSICEPTKTIGNLKETDYDFYKFWNLEKANKMKNKLKSCFCLQSCNLLSAMKYDTNTILRLLK